MKTEVISGFVSLTLSVVIFASVIAFTDLII